MGQSKRCTTASVRQSLLDLGMYAKEKILRPATDNQDKRPSMGVDFCFAAHNQKTKVCEQKELQHA
jgi:hypothetical protein